MKGLRENYQQLKSDWVHVKRTLALAAALPRFFREQVTLQKAEEELKRLLDTRVERFLELARSQIYQRPGSPYRRLMQHAGCEFSDLETSFKRHGLEETLAKLAGEGVYLTSDEFKGKTHVVRGKTSFPVSPTDFQHQEGAAGFTLQSSGSRNRPISTFSSLEWRGLQALQIAIFYSAHSLFSGAHAVYEPILAGRVVFVLINAKLGIPTDRWFGLNVPVHGVAEHSFHYLNARLIAMMGRYFGPGIANPEALDAKDARPVLDWILENTRQGKNVYIKTVTSRAARIARQAWETGISLEGTTFHASGEPLTQSKKQLIENAGAHVALHYGPGGGNGGALGCGNPRFIDEVHVPQGTFTLVENSRTLDYGDSSIHPLMITTMHPAAPRFLFNVENGDYATQITRDCGCPLRKIGSQQIHTVRSFEKMTSEGMNCFGTELFELLEDALPSEFGGGPGDYQLVEEEDHGGQTRLTLLAHPNIGALDEGSLLSRLHQGLAQGSRNHRFMSRIWQDAGTFRIRREAPYASAGGKILPLYIKRKE